MQAASYHLGFVTLTRLEPVPRVVVEEVTQGEKLIGVRP